MPPAIATITDLKQDTSSRAGPWRVLLADERKNLFHFVTDDRIQIQQAFDPERPPHLVVAPCPKLNGSFVEPLLGLPPEVWKGAALVLDASGKGAAPTGKFVRRLHQFMDARGIPEARCGFVTNNRRASLRGSGVRILHYDYWLRRLFRLTPGQGEAQFERRLAFFRARKASRPRRFLSFNLTARRWKLLSLLRDAMWDAGYVSFGGFDHLERNRGESIESVRRDLLAAPGLEDIAAELVQFLPALDAKGQVLFGAVDRTEDGRVRKPTDGLRVGEYDQTWFSVTTETDMSNAIDCVTEKSFKALLNFHPQVIMGHPGALARLRAFGFQSFSACIDESYDREDDPRRRLELAYAEVRRLCLLDEAEMARIERDLSDVLVANARWGLIGLPAHYRQVLDPEIVSGLLALCDAPPGSGPRISGPSART